MAEKPHVTRLNIVVVTSLRASHALTNSKGSRLCAVDDWIVQVSRQFIFADVWLAVFTTGPKIDVFCRSRVLLDYDFSAVLFRL